MRQPEKLYFAKSSPNIHPPQVGNKMSFDNNRLHQPVFLGNSEEPYGHQNYGFQPSDQDFQQFTPSGNRLVGLNLPIFPEDGNIPSGGTVHPMVSYASREQLASQHALWPTRATMRNRADHVKEIKQLPNSELRSGNDSAYHGHYETRQYSIPRIVQGPGSSGQGQAPQQFTASRTEILPMQLQVQQTDTINDDRNAIAKHQTTPIQLVSEKVVANAGNELETADPSQIIMEINVSQNEMLAADRPITPIAPDITNKVAFFEGKIGTNQSRKSTSYDEEIQRNYTPMPDVSEHSLSPIPKDESREPSNIAVYNTIATTELTSDESISKVCYYICSNGQSRPVTRTIDLPSQVLKAQEMSRGWGVKGGYSSCIYSCSPVQRITNILSPT